MTDALTGIPSRAAQVALDAALARQLRERTVLSAFVFGRE